MIYPRFIRENDVIGVTAPSLMVTEETDKARFRSAVANLQERGFGVRFTSHVFSDGEELAPADIRVAELEEVFSDQDIAYVSLAKGGYGESELVDLIDWDLLRRNPRWMQGYSDNTVVLFKYTVECDVAAVYGSNFSYFGMIPWHISVTENLDLLEGRISGQDSYPFHESGFHDRITGTEPISDDLETEWISAPGDCSFEGRMVGGCTDILKWLADSDAVDIHPFLRKYREDSFIWFMETYDMATEDISDFIKVLKEKGWLENVSGFIFGRPLTYPAKEYRELLLSLLSEYDVPKIFDADIGHVAPRMSIISGAVAKVSVTSGKGHIEYRFV